MATYQIGGQTIEADGPLSDADIDHIASQQAPAAPQRPAPPPQPNATPDELDPWGPNFNTDKYKQWQDANPNALTEFGKSVARGVDTTATGVANLFRTLRADTTNNPETAQHARDMRDRSMQEYKQRMADNPAEVPSYSDIKNTHDVSMYVADKLGGMSKYIASYFMGGLPGIMGTGAIDAGQQEATNPDATRASVLTAGGLGAATGALPVPFLKGSGGALSQAARGFLLGGPALGAAQGLTENIPRAVATGDPAQGLPSKEQLIDSILSGSIGLGTFGGIHGAANQLTAGSPPTQLPPTASPQKHADARLAERINDAADQNSYNLKKVAYNAGDGSKAALDTVHNGLSTDITSIWKEIRSTMPDPTSVDELQQLSQLDGIIKSARNKLKGRVGDDDLKTLSDAVGHTEEGRALIDLVRQSNSLTDLYNGGLKGGVSRWTDYLNPLGHGGPENSYQSVLAKSAGVGGKAGIEGLALITNPHLWPLAAAQVGAFGAGRGIDALTGNRSTVSRFVNDNSLAPHPVNMTGASSILRSRAEYGAAQDAQNLQAQQRGALQKASDQFEKQQAATEQARQRVTQAGYDQYLRDEKQRQSVTQKSYDQYQAEQAAAEQARLADREQQLRTQNRLDNNPGLGGFDRSVYDQTGLPPQETTRGLFELNRTGRITPQEFHSWFHSPRALMEGNAGNHIMDMLDHMARNGQLERDPDGQKQPNISTEAPQVQSVRNSAAYAAQAAGNQARVTAAMERVANSEHSSNSKQRINDAIAAIGRTNNRADAESVRQNLVQSLANHSPEAARYAHQELEPLVSQIRHATADTAIPKGSDLRAVTTDVTRDGNVLTRTLAAAYKLKNGIDKPAYDGKKEPDTGYLKTVADFHDKAVHDPSSPAVKASYGALARETIAQFKSLGGLKVETWKGDSEPYRNSKEMMRDVADNHHIWFLPTDSAFGGGDKIAHPMLADTGLKTVDGHPLLVNDVFRIVHDLYGHTQHGFQFGPVGEYNAFREHAQMYSDKALPALAAETLAQNAWVNFGPHSGLPVKERPFSDQKAYAFPRELLSRDPHVQAEAVVDNPELLGPEFTAILDEEKAAHRDPSDALAAALDRYLEKITNGQSQSSGGEGAQGNIPAAFNKYLGASASRLDALRTGNDTGRVANASDIGQPIIVYHGTGKDAPHSSWYTSARSLADNYAKTSADAYGGTPRVFSAQLRPKNPYITTQARAEGLGYDDAAVARLKAQGHDVIMTSDGHEIFVIDPSSISAPKSADIGLNPGEDVLARHPTAEAAQKVADALAKIRPMRVMREPDGRYAVVAGPKPQAERPMSQATSFVSGIEHPDGTMKGLTTPEVRKVASTIARLVEGGIPPPGQNGVYSEGNNTIRVYGGMEPEHHNRVLGHETGHAIEALAGVATTLKAMDKSDPLKAFHIVKQLSSLSALERPLLWESDSHLERTFSRDPKYVHEYRGRYDELLADSMAHYMQHPAETKKVAPLAAQFIRDLVNPSKIGKVIAFAGLGSMALPGLIAQALSSFYSGGDQEDAT